MKATLTERTCARLRERLARGEFPAGTQLVTRTLATEFGSSLAPVREAINRLTEEGLLVQVAGAGAFVRDLSLKDLDEAYVVRQAVEGCAAAQAAKNAGPQEIRRLERICDRWLDLVREIRDQPDQSATAEQRARWADMDREFHTALVAASHNSLLGKIIAEHRLLHTVFKTTRNVPEFTTLHSAAWVWRDHAVIVRAIRRRDAAYARDLMVHHLENGRTVLMDHLQAMGDL